MNKHFEIHFNEKITINSVSLIHDNLYILYYKDSREVYLIEFNMIHKKITKKLEYENSDVYFDDAIMVSDKIYYNLHPYSLLTTCSIISEQYDELEDVEYEEEEHSIQVTDSYFYINEGFININDKLYFFIEDDYNEYIICDNTNEPLLKLSQKYKRNRHDSDTDSDTDSDDEDRLYLDINFENVKINHSHGNLIFYDNDNKVAIYNMETKQVKYENYISIVGNDSYLHEINGIKYLYIISENVDIKVDNIFDEINLYKVKHKSNNYYIVNDFKENRLMLFEENKNNNKIEEVNCDLLFENNENNNEIIENEYNLLFKNLELFDNNNNNKIEFNSEPIKIPVELFD